LALVLLAGASIASGCGGGGGTKSAEPAVMSASERIAAWVAEWSGDVNRNKARPNEFEIPAPPSVALPSAADEIARDVHSAADDFATSPDFGGDAIQETQEVFCTWFDWYLETGEVVPDEDEFRGLLVRYGFNHAFTQPVSDQLRDAVERFRLAIVNAQNEVEATANAAAAGVCSIPDTD
jgi:hypothetical protein